MLGCHNKFIYCRGEARWVEDELTVFGRGATSLDNYILEDLDCEGDETHIADCR